MSCAVHGEYLDDTCRECLGQAATCNRCGGRTVVCKQPCAFAPPPTAAEIAAAKKQAEADLASKAERLTDRDFLRKGCAATDNVNPVLAYGVLRIAAALERIEDHLALLADDLRTRRARSQDES